MGYTWAGNSKRVNIHAHARLCTHACASTHIHAASIYAAISMMEIESILGEIKMGILIGSSRGERKNVPTVFKRC